MVSISTVSNSTQTAITNTTPVATTTVVKTTTIAAPTPTISTKNSSTVAISPPATAKLIGAASTTPAPLTAAQLLALTGDIPTNTVIKDTAANISANLKALGALTSIGNVASITLSDTKAGTITVARTDLTGDLSSTSNADANLTVLKKITSSYTLNVTGLTASDAITLKSPAKSATLSLSISDSVDNITANLTALQTAAKAKSVATIAITSATSPTPKPTLTITAAQLKASTELLATIKGDYDLTITGVVAADAVTVAGNADKVLKASGSISTQAKITISDTSANLVKNIAPLELAATAGRLTSITVSDGKALVLTETQIKTDSHFLATTFTSNATVEATDVAAADVSSVQSLVNANSNLTLTKESIADTAANIQTNLDNLEAGVKAGGIIPTTPTISQTPPAPLGPNQVYNPANGHVYEYVAHGTISWDAAKSEANSKTYCGVNGYLVNITSQAELDFIENSVAPGGPNSLNTFIGGALVSGSTSKWQWVDGPEKGTVFWDNGPVEGQFASWDTQNGYPNTGRDEPVLGINNYGIPKFGTEALTGYNGFIVEYSGFNTNPTPTPNPKINPIISSITATDKGSITVSNSTLIKDIDALKVLSGKYTLNVTDISVSDAMALKAPSKDATLAISVKDTAANVAANWDKLQSAAKAKTLTAITVTDSASSLLSMTAAQLKADADALKLVAGDYKLAVTGVAAADVAKTLTTKNIYSVEVKDTAANILKNLATIQTAVTAAKIQNVVITDATNPSLSINDIFALTTSLPNVTLGAGVKFNVKDTASNIIAHARVDIGDVIKNSGTVAITDKTTPNLTLADAITLKGITNLDKTTKYNVTDGGNAIANQASVTNDAILSGATKVTTAQIFSVAQYTALSNSKSFDQKTTYIIQDTSQNIIKQSNITGDKILSGASSVIIQDTAGSVTANLAALQTLANSQKLTNINLTDSGTPALNLTATQISSSALLLGKITSSFNAGNGVGFQPGNSVTSLTPWSAPATVNIAPNSFNFRTYERPINNGSILANVTMDAGQLTVDGPRSAALYLTPQDGLGNSGVPVKVADMKTSLPNGYGPPNGAIYTINFASSGNGTSASKNMQAVVWMDLQSDGTYSLKARTYTVSTTGIANDPNSASVTFNGDPQTLVSGISSKLANFNWSNINVANNTNMCFEYETLDATDPTKKNAYEASFAISSDYKIFNQLSTIAQTSGENAGALLIAPLMDAKALTSELSNGNNGQATFVYESTQNGQTGLVFNDLSSQNGIVQNPRFLPLGNSSDNIKLNAINSIPLTDPSGTSTYWMNQMIGVTGTSVDSVTGDKSNFVKFIKLNSWLPANSSDPNMTPLAVTTINLPNKPGGMWNCNTNYNTSMWAFQEGSSAHVVQVDGNGKIISDDKITLPPGAILDRIRNTNSTNTNMFELLWRETDPNNVGANIIKYQLYDLRGNAPQYVIDNTGNTLSYLAGAAGNDTLQGRGAGVNVFSGGAGNDTIISGTSGKDIASYTGKSSDYSIKLDPNDLTKIIVSDLRSGSPDGTDTLIGINKIRFSDTVIDASSIK